MAEADAAGTSDAGGTAAGGRGATRARMVGSAAILLGAQGPSGVTVDAVLRHSGAPRGSVYHHFPSGREELLLAGLHQAGDVISGRLGEALAEGDPRAAVRSFVRYWQRALLDTEFQAGCPVVAVVTDGRRDAPGAAEAAAAIFERWHRDVTALLIRQGYSDERAGRLATLMVAAIEGAIVLSRARRDVGPLDDVAAEIDLLLEP